MRKLSTAIALALLCACNSNGAPHDVPPENVVVKTVDKENNEFKAEKVTWWYSDKREIQYKSECAGDLCSTWTIGKEASGPITINANASRVKQNDDQCWDWFEGESVIEADQAVPQEVVIVLLYRATACT
ncbi:MAG: hypothetical protein ACR2P1_20050 [Pseudomonadales bacterium]